MPAVSRKQQRFMAMCAHNPGKAYKKCPPKSVAKEFSVMGKTAADKPKKDRHGYFK